MKRVIAILILMSACSMLNAQPKEMGLRAGAGGFEAAYQHRTRQTQFIEVDLGLDRDDGSLRYEGEAELDGKRYEFEMRVTGEIVEWDRD